MQKDTSPLIRARRIQRMIRIQEVNTSPSSLFDVTVEYPSNALPEWFQGLQAIVEDETFTGMAITLGEIEKVAYHISVVGDAKHETTTTKRSIMVGRKETPSMSISNPTPQEVDAALADLNSAYKEFCTIVETRYASLNYLQQMHDAYRILGSNFRFFKEAGIIAYYDDAWHIAPTKPEPSTFERVIIYSWGHAESTPDASYDGGMELLQRVRRGNETFLNLIGVTYRITSAWPVTDEPDTPVCGRIYATGVEILPQP